MIMPQFHDLANAFPLLTGEAFDELIADIREHGQMDPVVMYDGKILDGRNRWRACQALGIPHKEIKLPKDTDPVAFVWSKNAVRRQLTPSQRAMAATKLTTTKLGNNQHSDATTVQEAADMAGVGARSVHRAKTVIEHGVPELIEAVEAGELAVTPASEIAVKPKEEQKKILASGTDEAVKKAAADRAATVARRKVITGGGAPKTVMARHMESASAEGAALRTEYWKSNSDLIKEMEPAALALFLADLVKERQALSELIELITEETVSPEDEKDAAPAVPETEQTGTTTAAGAPETEPTPGSPAARKTAARKSAMPRKTAAKKPAAPRKAPAARKTASKKPAEE